MKQQIFYASHNSPLRPSHRLLCDVLWNVYINQLIYYLSLVHVCNSRASNKIHVIPPSIMYLIKYAQIQNDVYAVCRRRISSLRLAQRIQNEQYPIYPSIFLSQVSLLFFKIYSRGKLFFSTNKTFFRYNLFFRIQGYFKPILRGLIWSTIWDVNKLFNLGFSLKLKNMNTQDSR